MAQAPPLRSYEQPPYGKARILAWIPEHGYHVLRSPSTWDRASQVPPAPGHLPVPGESDPTTGPTPGFEHAPAGRLWAVYSQPKPMKEDGGTSRKPWVEITFVPFSPASGSWQPEQTVPLLWPTYLRTFLLSDDTVLALATHPRAIVVEGKAFPAAIFRRSGKDGFVLDSGETLALEGLPMPATSANWPQAWLRRFWAEAQVLWCGESTLLIAPDGRVWTFNARGRCRGPHQPKGYGFTGDLAANAQPWKGVVLGCQPTPEGEALFSLVEASATLYAQALLQDPEYLPALPALTQLPNQNERESVATSHAWFHQRLFSQPLGVRWYCFDPREEGHWREVPTPKGMPTALRSVEEHSRFRWHLDAKGRVVSGEGDAVPPAQPQSKPKASLPTR